MLLIFVLYGISLIVRTLRWFILLKCESRYNFYNLFYTWVIGNLMNAFLPARAGDVWRACSIGANSQESKVKLFGSVILERIFDGVSICILLYICIIRYADISWLKHLANLSMLMFGGILLGVYLIIRFNKLEETCVFFEGLSSKTILNFKGIINDFLRHLRRLFNLFVSGFESLKSCKYTIAAIFFSFSVWGVECLITYIVINSFNINCPISAALLVICFVAFGTMIPSSSIFIGPYQYAFILALSLYSIDKAEALAMSIINQSILISALLIFSLVLVVFNCVKIIKIRK